MKKGLIIIAAALFVAAMVLPAMAVDMSISGYYRVRGVYQSNADQGSITPWDNPTPGDIPTAGGLTHGYGSPDAYWDHLLQLNPVFKVADNLKLVTQVSVFNNQMWGSSETSGGVASTGALNMANYGDTADNILMNRAYIEWATPKGTLKVGRMAGNMTFFTPWANTILDADRIMYYSPSWGGFNFFAGYEKRNEQSATSGNNIADEDEDRYFLCLNYAQPCYFLGYALDYYRDRSESGATTDPNGIWAADYYKHVFCLKANDHTNTYFFEGELQIQDGDYRDYYGAAADVDRKGWGYYANLGMKKGVLTVGVATAYTSGDDNSSDADMDVGPASGLDFQPLYILYGPQSNVLNTTLSNPVTKAGYNSTTAFAVPGATATGSQAYWLYADYQCSPELALHGALGQAYADKVVATVNADDEFGTELDLGLKYQIMSNLAYELHLGYLWTGDFFKGTTSNNYTTDDVYQIDHSLTLSF
ncbi:MAG: hypothetical protein AB1487_05100 [Thermodesulfobacteriota bacterium]